MNSDVEEIKSRINIVDLVGEYVKLQKTGANWKAPCPFHNEKTPSFTVSEEKQIWHCFGCGKGGDAFGFLMELEGLGFREVLKLLAERVGIQLSGYSQQTTDTKNRTLEILELATKFYEKQLWDGVGKEKILNYLRGRGLNDETVKEFRLGYAPDGWRNVIQFLEKRGYKPDEIKKTGLVVEKNDAQISNIQSCYDRFRDRIMFPISDVMGKIIGFSARVAPGGDESQAKYINTPETSIYHKSKILYGINLAKSEIKSQNFVLLVEGNTDVMAAAQAGIKNTVAVSGTALTDDHLDILKRYTENIKMLFDMDAAGQLASLKSAKLAFQKDCNVFIVEISGAKDAAELAVKDPEILLKSVGAAVPAMEYFFGQIFKKYNKNKAGDKKIIAKEVLNIINSLENKIEKTHWLKKLAQELDVEYSILVDILEKDNSKVRKFAPKDDRQRDDVSIKKRAEVMRDEMIGLALVDSLAWQKVAALKDGMLVDFLKKDILFCELIEKGAQSEFKLDSILSNIENEEIIVRMRKIQFNAKYEIDSQSGIEEKTTLDNLALVEQYCQDIKKELSREKLEMITKDLKKAENAGDKSAIDYLTQEYSKILREMNC